MKSDETYASSKLLIASLIPSAPKTSVPYGNLPVPETFLSSDTRSDSSLHQGELDTATCEWGFHEPEKREDSGDSSDSKDLVFNNLAAF